MFLDSDFYSSVTMRLKYVDYYWMKCSEICCRYSLSQVDPMTFYLAPLLGQSFNLTLQMLSGQIYSQEHTPHQYVPGMA